MSKLREIFYAWRLKNQKMRALFEIEQDLQYLSTFKAQALKKDEGSLRKRMAELKKKEDPSSEEMQELDQVMNEIAESKAVKNEYEKCLGLVNDLKNYISLL